MTDEMAWAFPTCVAVMFCAFVSAASLSVPPMTAVCAAGASTGPAGVNGGSEYGSVGGDAGPEKLAGGFCSAYGLRVPDGSVAPTPAGPSSFAPRLRAKDVGTPPAVVQNQPP